MSVYYGCKITDQIAYLISIKYELLPFYSLTHSLSLFPDLSLRLNKCYCFVFFVCCIFVLMTLFNKCVFISSRKQFPLRPINTVRRPFHQKGNRTIWISFFFSSLDCDLSCCSCCCCCFCVRKVDKCALWHASCASACFQRNNLINVSIRSIR